MRQEEAREFQEARRLFNDGKSKTEGSKILNITKPTIIKWWAGGSEALAHFSIFF